MATLSVIVPVFNTADTLERCVSSILSQQVDGLELILVDDGSTDSSPALCDRLSGADDRVRVIHRANGGLSAARNTGIDAATGTWIAFVDSDDELAPDTLSANLDLATDNVDLVEFPVSVHYGAPNCYELDFKPLTVLGDEVFSHWIKTGGYTPCYAWNKIYRSTLFEDIRYPDGENFEDAAVCPSIIRRCRAVTYSDRGRYLYYSSGGGITRQYRFANQEPLFRHNLELLRLITDRGFGNLCRARLWNQCLNLLIDLARCKDADKEYISRNAASLASLKPAGATRYAGSLKQGIKAVLGPAAACKLLSIRKYK